MERPAVEIIKQRRFQMIVHSYIYYELNDNIVSDVTWSKWAQELVELQKKYPDDAKLAPFDSEFSDFDGSTGFNLPKDAWVNEIAQRLLKSKNAPKPQTKPKPQTNPTGTLNLFE